MLLPIINQAVKPGLIDARQYAENNEEHRRPLKSGWCPLFLISYVLLFTSVGTIDILLPLDVDIGAFYSLFTIRLNKYEMLLIAANHCHVQYNDCCNWQFSMTICYMNN